MTVSDRRSTPTSRHAGLAGVLGLVVSLGGCAGMSDGMSTAFADPGKYELYDCKQLEAERKSLATRAAELQGLMAKAETGTGGAVVAELAYRNDYIAIRGQSSFAEQAWRRNKCQDTPPPPPPVPVQPRKRGQKMSEPRPLPPISTLPRGGSTY